MPTDNTTIGPDTLVSGAEFRDFYHNHWPAEWYVEEMPYEAEDEQGNWVLADDAKRRLDWFGCAVWQGPNDKGRRPHEMIPMHELYAEVMGKGPQELVLTFKVDPARAAELISKAEELGARKI